MKTILVLMLSACGLLADSLRTNVTLIWNYDVTQLTNTTFILRGTNQLGSAAASWPIMATVTGQTNRPTATNLVIDLQPQAFFFVCQASNLWGLSDPSNVASTPAPPRSDFSLGVK
jgi:hypothetical protein